MGMLTAPAGTTTEAAAGRVGGRGGKGGCRGLHYKAGYSDSLARWRIYQ